MRPVESPERRAVESGNLEEPPALKRQDTNERTVANLESFLSHYKGDQALYKPSRTELCQILAPSEKNPLCEPYCIGMEPINNGRHPVRGAKPDGRFRPRPLERFFSGLLRLAAALVRFLFVAAQALA